MSNTPATEEQHRSVMLWLINSQKVLHTVQEKLREIVSDTRIPPPDFYETFLDDQSSINVLWMKEKRTVVSLEICEFQGKMLLSYALFDEAKNMFVPGEYENETTLPPDLIKYLSENNSNGS